jgi:ATP-dependent DNA helicase RecQ
MTVRLTTPEETLRQVFGFPEFRLSQREIVEHVIAGGDAFVLMPTGGGKSLCYQIPALHRHGTALVVSPLISIMKDQVDSMAQAGVAAATLHSGLDREESQNILRRLRAGRLDLLYLAPERLMNPAFLGRLEELPVALVAIDEAHCVSQWGHDFRPEYTQLGPLREKFSGVPFIALTATADEQTRRDIREQLRLTSAPTYAAGFDRPNIRYLVMEKRSPFRQLTDFLTRHRDESGIVYCLSRRRVEEVSGKLRAEGRAAAPYHAGLPADLRTQTQEAFTRDQIQIVVATVAFGLGIDKPDVRFVVHFDLPKSIEAY